MGLLVPLRLSCGSKDKRKRKFLHPCLDLGSDVDILPAPDMLRAYDDSVHWWIFQGQQKLDYIEHDRLMGPSRDFVDTCLAWSQPLLVRYRYYSSYWIRPLCLHSY